MYEILNGDAIQTLKTLPEKSVNCCITSPPYWGLRNYGVAGQLGMEATPDEFASRLVEVFREVRRVLRDDGTAWLNLGDSFANTSAGAGGKGKQWTNVGTVQMRGIKKDIPPGLKPKDLCGVPWRVAFALQNDGWYLRSDIIWAKRNPMPESVTDRPTRAHEYIFLLAKSERYYYDHVSSAEPAVCAGKVAHNGGATGMDEGYDGNRTREGLRKPMVVKETRHRRSVWDIPLQPFKGAHFATFPEKLVEPCILAGCPPGGTVLDPFCGSGTTLLVAQRHGRNGIGIELNPEYIELAKARIEAAAR